MENKEIKLALSGVRCAGCVNAIQKALDADNSVISAEINFANRTAQVITADSAEHLIEVVEKSGYGAKEIIDPEKAEEERIQQEEKEYRQKKYQAAIALIFSIPLMLYGFLGGDMSVSTAHQQLIWGAVAVVTFIIMVVSGRHFYVGAYRSFIHRNANMDTLIAIGTGTAWLYSICVILFPSIIPESARHLYLEASIMILGLINLGQALEVKARGRTSKAIHRLLDLRLKKALLVQNGQEIEVDIDVIQVGDILRARAGEKIAVDGTITDGATNIDESMLTGEPIPIHKEIGDAVSAGTVNGNSSILYQAQSVGNQTKLAQIIELVGKAQNSKPPISHLADRVSAIFVPTVMIIAIISALIWYNFGPAPEFIHMVVVATSVLIIACPCALGLATPISTMIAVGKAAEFGGIIRSGESLQKASKIDCVIVDKTGTLTQGKPSVSNSFFLNGDSEKLLNIVYQLEKRSHHPLAAALANYAQEQLSLSNQDNVELELSNFNDITALGVEADIDSEHYFLGSQRLMQQQAINYSAADSQIAEWLEQSKTLVYLSSATTLLAIFALENPVRKDSPQAIKALIKQGIKVVMLTGDNQQSASHCAKTCGIEEFYAELMPNEKLEHITRLQTQGLSVAMVGDGVNDAPALAQADVSFAVGTGTDVAIETADITLMRDSLLAVVDVLAVSRTTMRNIKENLWGAFIYNSLGIPLAAGALFPLTGWLLSPIIAGAAMSMSSITVVSNANRLRLFKAPSRYNTTQED